MATNILTSNTLKQNDQPARQQAPWKTWPFWLVKLQRNVLPIGFLVAVAISLAYPVPGRAVASWEVCILLLVYFYDFKCPTRYPCKPFYAFLGYLPGCESVLTSLEWSPYPYLQRLQDIITFHTLHDYVRYIYHWNPNHKLYLWPPLLHH